MMRKLASQLKKQDWKSSLKQKRILLNLFLITFLSVIGLIHINIFAGVKSYRYNPFWAIGLYLVILTLSILFGKLKEYFEYLLLLFLGNFFQIWGYYQNGGVVYDYFNFFLFWNNLPDLVIFGTLLTFIVNKVYISNHKIPA